MHARPQTWAVAILCSLTLAAAPAAPATTAPATTRPAVAPGAGRFVFTDQQGDPGKPITVWTWCPDDLSPTTPILFVMHGALRNGETYRNNWVKHARERHALLVVPEFDRTAYPGTAYNDGNLFDPTGQPVDPSRWVFATVEHLFDQVKRLTGNRSATYLLYGHSAGGQVVERFVLLMPTARYSRAIAANPGWYTLPDPSQPFPAGLGRTPTTDDVLRTIVQRDVVVMLGERDTNPNDRDLNRSPPAMAEGPYRFARGQFFWKDLQAAAARLHAPLAWQLKTVPEAGHSDPQMSVAAIDLLFPPSVKP